MPHECTACGRTFADGSKEMLSGCPDCGGTKFQFRPRTSGSSADADATPDTDAPADDGAQVTGREWPMHGDEPSDERRTRGRVGSRARGAPAGDDSASTRGDSTATQDDPPSTRPDNPTAEDGPATADDGPTTTDDGIVVADEEPVPPGDDEDSAQADARSGFAAPDEVAQGAATTDDAAGDPGSDSRPAPDPADADDTPDLSALREELNDQFESIKIVSPGQYELNLMELYEREEHIISLREDGRYVIEVPETWRSG